MIQLQPPDWWEAPPVLTGSTVLLREVGPQDVESLFELLTDPKVSQYISPPPPSTTAFEGFIAWAHQQRADGACICFAIVPKGLNQAIGLFQLRALDPTFRIAEWGFALGAAFWGTGVFREAAILVAEFAFREIGVHRLEARAVTANKRGNRVLEKLGARGEATLRKAFGHRHTQFLWAILAEEWNPAVAPRSTVFDAARLKREIEKLIADTPSPARRSPGAATPFPFFLVGGANDPTDEN